MLSMGPREHVLCVGTSVEPVSAPRFLQYFDLLTPKHITPVATHNEQHYNSPLGRTDADVARDRQLLP